MGKDFFGNKGRLYLPLSVKFPNRENLEIFGFEQLKNKSFIRFSCLVITKGYYKAMVLDPQRGYYHSINLDLADLLEKKTIKFESFDDIETLKELLEHEILFSVDEKMLDFFPSKNFITKHSEFYLQLKIDIKNSKDFLLFSDLLKFNKAIKLLVTIHLSVELDDILSFLSEIRKNIDYVSLEFSFKDSIEKESIENLLKNEKRIHFTIFDNNQNNELTLSDDIILRNYNINSYSYNTLVLSNDGEMFDCYGNYFGKYNLVNELSLKEIENLFEEQLYHVKKDEIDICKVCDLRMICLDKRKPIYRINDNSWYHNTECSYNPFIALWDGDEGYKTLEECGVISNEHEFSIDHEKIALINKELWEDE